MKPVKLEQKEFIHILNTLNYYEKDNYDYLYEVYDFVIDSIYQVINASELNFSQVNHYIVILYILNEFTYSLALFGNDKKRIL